MSKSYAVYEVVTGEIKQVIMTPFEKEVDAISYWKVSLTKR